jgi:hypothetical protein
MIPGLFTIGKALNDLSGTNGITGNAIDNSTEISHPEYAYVPTQTTILIGGAIIVLAIAFGLTILFYKIKFAMKNMKSKSNTKPKAKVTKSIKSKSSKKGMSGMGMINMHMNGEKAGMCMLMMVAIVAIIGIVIMIMQ